MDSPLPESTKEDEVDFKVLSAKSRRRQVRLAMGQMDLQIEMLGKLLVVCL